MDASASAQWYSLTRPFDGRPLRRQRYVSTLGLDVFDLTPMRRPSDPSLSFKARLRIDADLGQEPEERDPRRDDRYVPGLAQAPLDVMTAYLEGERYLGGWLGFRLGRQYVVDPIGWWSFDGALLKLGTPAYVATELYAGWEQRSAMLLSTQRFESDGVWRGSRAGLEAGSYPSLLEERRLAPAWGAAIATTGLHHVQARASYRKVWNRDVVYLSQYPDLGGGFSKLGGARVSSERVGLSAGSRWARLGAVDANAVWDLYTQRLADASAQLDAFLTERLSLGASYDYVLPVFDADSIWNFFSHQGSSTLASRLEARLDDRHELLLRSGLRRYVTDDGTASREAPAGGSLFDVLGSAEGRRRWAAGSLGLRTSAEAGQRGHRYGGDLTLQQRFQAGLYDATGVLSLYDWSDALREGRDVTGFAYVLGGGYSPLTKTRLGLAWEHATNRLVGQRYRLLATLDVAVAP